MDIKPENIDEVMTKVAKELTSEALSPEELNKIRLPANFNQDNCFLRLSTPYGNSFYIDYSIQFGFPITKFMNHDEMAHYVTEYYEKFLPKEGVSVSSDNPTMYIAIKTEHIEALIKDNHAGPNHECIKWNEIVNLYGKEILKEQDPLPLVGSI
jgi:hypothetical protein